MKPRVLLLVLAALVVGGLLWGPGLGSEDKNGQTDALTPSATADVDPDSGLPVVPVDSLAPEAQDTLALIDAGGPFPYEEDGGVFGNREGILPDRDYGHYLEYTVPTPGSADRGARRIVTGDVGEYYWTEDHYQSFERISR